jgi:16S rRNA (adenine1518-N6/adenine1519-N6)-dimethyltransferase
MGNGIDTLPPLRDVIAAHGLRAEKSLGQNFLLDLNLTRKIARFAAPLDRGTVIEIGPGPGGLTRALALEGAKHIIAIEKDFRTLPALTEIQAAFSGKLEILQQDALKIAATELGSAPRRIVANLPYNIATPLLIEWLRAIATQPDSIAQMVLMFQKEVGERILAKPNTKAYGRLAVLCQWLCECEGVMTLPPSAFTPAPKVESMVVRFTPRPQKLFAAEFSEVEQLTQAAFGQRRKMLRAALKTRFGDQAEARLITAGIDPTRRAENLSVAEFGRLI